VIIVIDTHKTFSGIEEVWEQLREQVQEISLFPNIKRSSRRSIDDDRLIPTPYKHVIDIS
jgi:hypothetical protein